MYRTGIAWLGIGAIGLCFLAACSADSQSAESDPTTRALADPMGYSPDFDNASVTDGKGISDVDSPGLKRDVNHVVNPP